jgi:hypothetical protein
MSDHYIDSRTHRLRQSAKAGDRSESSAEPERFRLEDSKGACARAATRSTLSLHFALICSVWLLPGCVSDSFQVIEPLSASQASVPLAPEVLLEVDDAGVKWGRGKVGDVLKSTWVHNRTFGEVHYPIYPTRTIPLKLRVVASGTIRADEGLGTIKAIVTGLLLLLPVGVIQYKDTFSINAMVSLIRNDRSYGPLAVQSAVQVDHILFSNPDSYTARATDLVLDHLASRISILLRRHPEWFSE